MAKVSFIEAIRQAQYEELERDKNVFLMGEDLVCNVFGTTTDFLEAFGPERIRDTPISEEGFVGAAAGASMVGMRAIVDLTIASFVYPAMDQICSIIAKSRYIYGGQAKLPLVLRMCMFYGNANAAQHSDRPYPMFMGMPGLKIIVPSCPSDMKGLLKSAIRDDDPVLSFEDGTLWSQKDEIPDDKEYLVPLGVADVKRKGKDVTIVAIGGAVPLAIKAATIVEADGISVEVVDPRTLVPLDCETILESVRKTGRVITVDPAHEACSVASEISAMIAERAFSFLEAPILRVTTPNAHIPFCPSVEKNLFPTVDRIVTAIRSLSN